MKVTGEERLFGILGYLFFLFIIPLNAKKGSLFVQFHSRQGMVLFFLWLMLSILVLIVLAFTNSVQVVQSIIIGLWIIGTILYSLLAIIGIFKVMLGERYRMPVVADIALKLNL